MPSHKNACEGTPGANSLLPVTWPRALMPPPPLEFPPAEGAEVAHAGRRVPHERMGGVARGVAGSRHLAAGVDAAAEAVCPAEGAEVLHASHWTP
jgi:hypothetical protein